jgi:hypothetical protein
MVQDHQTGGAHDGYRGAAAGVGGGGGAGGAGAGGRDGSRLDPAETVVTLADRIGWEKRKGYPADSVASAALFGSRNG